MYSIRYDNTKPNFKICSMKDVRTFLGEMFNGDAVINVSKQYCIFVRKRYNEGNLIQVSDKRGKLQDIFNPEFVYEENEAIKLLYKYRKYINDQILSF